MNPNRAIGDKHMTAQYHASRLPVDTEPKDEDMPNATIFPNATSDLSWSSSSSVTALTENSTTVVLNSSGDRVYWTEGANSGSFANTKSLTCTQGPTNKIWGFSDQSGGAAKITLTVTGSSGGG